MSEFLSRLFQVLFAWCPRLHIVHATHNAVKFVAGRAPRRCLPGMHWYWPITTTIEDVPIVRDSVDTEAQVLCDERGDAFVVSATFEYRVNHPVIAVAGSADWEKVLVDVSGAAIADVVATRRLTVAGLRTEIAAGTLGSRLEARTRELLEPYGIEITSATITEFAPCRVLKHFGSPLAVEEEEDD